MNLFSGDFFNSVNWIWVVWFGDEVRFVEGVETKFVPMFTELGGGVYCMPISFTMKT